MRKITTLLLTATILSIQSLSYIQKDKKIEDYFAFNSSITRHIPHKLHLNYSPEDPYYTGEKVASGNNQKIAYGLIGDMETIWNKYTGKGVMVAVIDTGVDINHQDFYGNVSNRSAYFYTEYESPEDLNSNYEVKHEVGLDKIYHDVDEAGQYLSHGTSVSGTILAKSDDKGSIGVAFDAELLSIKCDLEEKSVNEAIKYAVDQGAKVINLSLGGYCEPYYDGREEVLHDEENKDYYIGVDTSMVEGINYAYEKGAIIIAAAGNESTSTSSFPASNKHVIGVGAINNLKPNERANFSNYNKDSYKEGIKANVDICAPGYVVAPSSIPNKEDYDNAKYLSGTSFSAPLVSGAAALWLEKYPNGTPDDFKEALFKSANDIGEEGYDNYFGYGSLNITELLKYNDKDEDFINHTKASEIQVEEYIELFENEEYQLNVNVLPADAKYELSYISSDENIIAVNEDGLIKALKEGEAKITIQVDKISASCRVIVKKKEVIDPSNNKKCGGEIIITSSLLSLSSLLGIALIIYKKKKNQI